MTWKRNIWGSEASVDEEEEAEEEEEEEEEEWGLKGGGGNPPGFSPFVEVEVRDVG